MHVRERNRETSRQRQRKEKRTKEKQIEKEKIGRQRERKGERERERERKKERINKQNFEYLNACFLCSWRETTYKSFKSICPSIYLHTHIYLAIFMTVPACP